MSDRERWIIYPLLFFALSLAARDQLWFLKPKKADFDRTEVEFHSVRCNELRTGQIRIDAPSGKRSVHIGTSVNGGGGILVFGRNENQAVAIRVDPLQQAGIVETFHRSGKPLVRLSATDRGGLVLAMIQEGEPHLVLGHDSNLDLSGLFAVDLDGKMFLVGTNGVVNPWGVQMKWKPKEKPEQTQPQP